MDGNAMTNVLGGDKGSIVDDKQDEINNNVRQLAERETDIHVGDSSLSQAPVADVQSREIDLSVIGASLAGPSSNGDTPEVEGIDREEIMKIIFNDESNGYNEKNLDWDTMKELYSAVQQNHGMAAVLVEPPTVDTQSESNHVVVGESDSTPLDAEQVVSATIPEADSDNSQVIEGNVCFKKSVFIFCKFFQETLFQKHLHKVLIRHFLKMIIQFYLLILLMNKKMCILKVLNKIVLLSMEPLSKLYKMMSTT